MPKNVTHSSWFWILFASLSLAGMIFSYHYFPRAFPIVNLDLEMNRHTALAQATKIAKALQLGPTTYKQAASFEIDNKTKNFIELEGGGKTALSTVLADKIYSPYYWTVRHFQEHNPKEVHIYFNPDGTPYGFTEKIPENQPGPAILQEEAQNIAEQQASKYWNVDFSYYSLIEISHEEKPNKRLDYTFVYERTDKKVKKAHYRLTLIIQGDRLTELKPSLQVPEGFSRRYEHMRSANKTISIIALFFIIVLYVFGCCLGGLIYLYHRGLLRWRMPMLWACIIATLQLLNCANSTPLIWLQYNTAISISNFLVHMLLNIILQWGLLFCLLSLIFSVAEGLTRCAFGDHPQLWKLWKPKYASSWQVLGRTVTGYLIVGFDIAFVIIIYAFATRYFGWWTPSEALINPNILATYVPWFSSIAQSAMAGFMEECLFRALPLASAMLLGKYFRKPILFLSIAFILQALVFGAAHANYPAQPAYARLLELFIPSCIFGGLYLAYGLLPAIISHFIYDVVWFSLPLFITKAPGSLVNQIMVVTVAALPLALVLIARLRIGKWTTLTNKAYNKIENLPKVKEGVEIHRLFYIPRKLNVHENYYIAFLAAGIAGLLLWAGVTRFDHDGIQLPSDRMETIETTQQLFNATQPVHKPWIPLAAVKTDLDPQHVFIWRTHGNNVYKKLLGTYLVPAYWHVRFASFQGDIAKRAEEYHWYLGPNRTVLREHHILPEEQSGKSITQEQADSISTQALTDYFKFSPEQIQKVSAVSSKKPNRIDWTFTYHTPTTVQLKKGQTRATTTVSDNKVTNIYKHIFVPEQWLREYTNEKTMDTIILLSCSLILVLLFLMLTSLAILHHGFFNIHYPTFIIFGVCLLTKSSIQFYNLWPIFQANFSTSQPYNTQTGITLIATIIGIIFNALLYSYLASIFYSIHMHIVSKKSFVMHIVMGISAGTVYTGISALLKYIGPAMQPLWPDYSYLGAHIPWLNMALMNGTLFINLSIQALLIFLGIDYLTQGWHRRKLIGTGICILLGIALTGAAPIETVPWMIISGFIRGVLFLILYIFILRYERIRIIWTLAALFICNIIQQIAFNAWPGVFTGGIFSIALIILISFIWTWHLQKHTTN